MFFFLLLEGKEFKYEAYVGWGMMSSVSVIFEVFVARCKNID